MCLSSRSLSGTPLALGSGSGACLAYVTFLNSSSGPDLSIFQRQQMGQHYPVEVENTIVTYTYLPSVTCLAESAASIAYRLVEVPYFRRGQ